MLRLGRWESVSQHFRLIDQLVRIFLPLYFLWHELGKPLKGCRFLESLFPDYIPCSFKLPNSSLDLFFNFNDLAITSSNFDPELLASLQSFFCHLYPHALTLGQGMNYLVHQI